MNDLTRQIIATICGADRYSNQLINSLPPDANLGPALLAAAEQQAHEMKWRCVCRLIWVMQRLPDKQFVPFLSQLLDDRQNDGCMEAVVDALNVMPDKSAVIALRKALSYRLPGDDLAFHFNKKVILALDRIGTDEALSAIRTAEESPEEPIREFAHQLLSQNAGLLP